MSTFIIGFVLGGALTPLLSIIARAAFRVIANAIKEAR